MARVVTDNAHYADIAAAIRTKLSSQELFLPEEMPAAILSIETGARGLRARVYSSFAFYQLPMAWSSTAVVQEQGGNET